VAVDPDLPLGRLHSAVIDRAAALQRHAAPGQVVVGAEVTPAALRQLDTLAPLDDPAGGDGAFAWGPR